MDKSEWVSFEEMKVKALQDPDFAHEYEILRDEFKLAQEVIELRKQRNMTQRELAKKAGTSQPAIARLESGRYENVSMAFMKKIGKALGAEPVIHLRVQG